MSLGKGPKTAFGCLTALVVCTIGLVLFALRTMDDRDRRAERFVQRFVDLGYELNEQDAIILRRRTEGPVILRNTSEFKPLYINSNISGDVAIVAPTISIAGKIDGNVNFFAGKITILGSGEISGDLISAYPADVQIDGLVAGKLDGSLLHVSRATDEATDDSSPTGESKSAAGTADEDAAGTD